MRSPSIHYKAGLALALTGLLSNVLATETNSANLEQCYLRALAIAEPNTTVAMIRETCKSTNPETLRPQTVVPATASQIKTNEPAIDSSRPLTLFERRRESELIAWGQPFALMLHRPNYLLPVTYQSARTGFGQKNQRAEATFQISFKFPLSPPLMEGRLVPFFAYTGKAWWQVYDSDRSRPFREYNHEPELLLATRGFDGEIFGWRNQIFVLGFNHQSNGRSVPESRSWNRITFEALIDKGQSNWAAIKLWYRLGERAKANPLDQGGDDNPDIARYLGYGEIRLGDVTAKNHFTLTLRRSLHSNGKGAAQFDWSYPLPFAPSLRFYSQLFDGYGESLIDYNQRTRRIGIGFMLNDWF